MKFIKFKIITALAFLGCIQCFPAGTDTSLLDAYNFYSLTAEQEIVITSKFISKPFSTIDQEAIPEILSENGLFSVTGVKSVIVLSLAMENFIFAEFLLKNRLVRQPTARFRPPCCCNTLKPSHAYADNALDWAADKKKPSTVNWLLRLKKSQTTEGLCVSQDGVNQAFWSAVRTDDASIVDLFFGNDCVLKPDTETLSMAYNDAFINYRISVVNVLRFYLPDRRRQNIVDQAAAPVISADFIDNFCKNRTVRAA